MDVVAYLTGKGIRVYPARGDEVTIHCLWCDPGHGGTKGKGKLYVNKHEWTYFCQVCHEKGGRRSLMAHFGDTSDERQVTVAISSDTKHAALAAYSEMCQQALAANPKMLDYLLGRGLRIETVVEAGLGYAPRGFSVTGSILDGEGKQKFPVAVWKSLGLVTDKGRELLSGCITIPYTYMGNIVQVRGRVMRAGANAKYLTPGGQDVVFYGQDELKGKDRALITEGELDKLMIQQTMQGHPELERTAILGAPGTGAGYKLAGEQLADLRRIFIAYDPDTDGVKAAAKIKAEMGTAVRIVRLPREEDNALKMDWSEYLVEQSDIHPYGGHTASDVMSLITRAEMEGKTLFTIEEAIQGWEAIRSRPQLRLGFSSIDKAIFPGIAPGSVVVPLAKTGTAKSISLANLAVNFAARPVLHVTLENTAASVVEHLLRINQFYDPLVTIKDLPRLMPNWQVYDGNRLDLHRLGELIEQFTLERGVQPEILLLDHLAYLAQGMTGGSKYERTSEASFLLKEMSKTYNLITFCPHQLNRNAKAGEDFDLDDSRDSGAVEETADYILGMWRPSRALKQVGDQRSDDGKLMLRVLKSRTGGIGATATLMVSNASLVIVDTNAQESLLRKVEQENLDLARGKPWDAILRTHREHAHLQRQEALTGV